MTLRKTVIEKSTLDFLRKLTENNNREWFNSNKEKYLQSQLNIEQFMDALIARMNRHDRIETISGKKSLYRIYNDVRFSKDKSPYNPRFAGYLKRVKPLLRGGYYFWIKSGGSRVGCGFSYPSADDLKRIRMDISMNHEDWYTLLQKKNIVANFGTVKGEKLTTTPRGFPANHAAIELLRLKQFWFEHPFTDREVLADDFLTNVNTLYKSIRPFFDYMSEVLTTDLNGESLIVQLP